MRKSIKKIISTLMMFTILSLVWPAQQVMAASPGITYSAHVAENGWLSYVSNGAGAGSVGHGLRTEAVKIKLKNADGGVKYQIHVQEQGWTSWVSDGKVAGTTGKGLRTEALKVKLTGNIAKTYDVYYRTHIQDQGWTGWSKNGAISGTTGKSRRMEALQIQLVKKGKSPAKKSDTAQKVVVPVVVPKGQQVADFACQFLGNPYVYGGTSLTHGCDCSGFVMKVYENFGVSLPHSSASIRNYGTAVSLNNILPGDVVCYQGHVGIYVDRKSVV